MKVNAESIVQLTLKKGQKLILEQEPKRKNEGSFYMVGKESLVNKSKVKGKPEWEPVGIDFVDEMVNMTTTEQMAVKILKDGIRWDESLKTFNYIVELTKDSVCFNPELPNSYLIRYETFLKAFNTLHQRDLVRRVRRSHYMFNPAFLMPSGPLSAPFRLQWAQSKVGSKDGVPVQQRTHYEAMDLTKSLSSNFLV